MITFCTGGPLFELKAARVLAPGTGRFVTATKVDGVTAGGVAPAGKLEPAGSGGAAPAGKLGLPGSGWGDAPFGI